MEGWSLHFRVKGRDDVVFKPYFGVQCSRLSLNGIGGAPPEKYHLEREYHLGLDTLGYCEYPQGPAALAADLRLGTPAAPA